jgi:hypothetical protein
VLGQDGGALDERLVGLDVLVADGGRAQAHFERDTAFHLRTFRQN